MEILIEILAEVFGEVLIESLRHITLPKWMRWSLYAIFILGAIALLIFGIYRLGWILLQACLCVAALALLIIIGYAIYHTCHYGTMRLAKKDELPQILQMYRDVIGRPGCNWSISYPNEITLQEDFRSGNLYVLCKGCKIIGAGSIVTKNELDDLLCWHFPENAREIARIVIKPEFQSQGHGKHLARRLCIQARKSGAKAVHLLVSTENAHAIRLYRNISFWGRAQCNRYGHTYYAFEKKL